MGGYIKSTNSNVYISLQKPTGLPSVISFSLVVAMTESADWIIVHSCTKTKIWIIRSGCQRYLALLFLSFKKGNAVGTFLNAQSKRK